MIGLVRKLLDNERKIEAALKPCDCKGPQVKPDEKKKGVYACA